MGPFRRFISDLPRWAGLSCLISDRYIAAPGGYTRTRTLKMPYSQFLFSSEFIRAKLEALGIWDLGQARSELQNLNRWKLSQFERLWLGSGLRVIQSKETASEEYISMVMRYPECFTGRGLTFNDLTCANIVVTLRKDGSLV